MRYHEIDAAYEQQVREEREQRERMLEKRREEQRVRLRQMMARRHREDVRRALDNLRGMKVE